MSEKPASMYRDIDKPAYTRREYITGIPGSKVAQHKMGDREAPSPFQSARTWNARSAETGDRRVASIRVFSALAPVIWYHLT